MCSASETEERLSVVVGFGVAHVRLCTDLLLKRGSEYRKLRSLGINFPFINSPSGCGNDIHEKIAARKI